MNKKSKLPNTILILVMTLVTAFVWVTFSVYRAFTTKPSPTVPDEVSASLTPSLNQDSINKIESALFFNDSQIPDNVQVAPSQTQSTIQSSLPTPIPTPATSASPSANASSSATTNPGP